MNYDRSALKITGRALFYARTMSYDNSNKYLEIKEVVNINIIRRQRVDVDFLVTGRCLPHFIKNASFGIKLSLCLSSTHIPI